MPLCACRMRHACKLRAACSPCLHPPRHLLTHRHACPWTPATHASWQVRRAAIQGRRTDDKRATSQHIVAHTHSLPMTIYRTSFRCRHWPGNKYNLGTKTRLSSVLHWLHAVAVRYPEILPKPRELRGRFWGRRSAREIIVQLLPLQTPLFASLIFSFSFYFLSTDNFLERERERK